MSTQNYLTPPEITEATIETGIKKSKMTIVNMIILGILAGAFIAFAAEASNMASFNLLAKVETYGLGVTSEKLNHLNWEPFFTRNLIPVTLGNIVGGGIFVAAVYWYVYRRQIEKE